MSFGAGYIKLQLQNIFSIASLFIV